MGKASKLKWKTRITKKEFNRWRDMGHEIKMCTNSFISKGKTDIARGRVLHVRVQDFDGKILALAEIQRDAQKDIFRGVEVDRRGTEGINVLRYVAYLLANGLDDSPMARRLYG